MTQPVDSSPSRAPESPSAGPDARVIRYAESNLPTEYGTMRCVVFTHEATGREHVALVLGDVSSGGPALARVHSECLTGEVFHSLKCDCREQLDLALRRVAAEGAGMVVYLRQEGRGIGLGNKIRAYAKQEQGLDTVDANRAIGFEDDLRAYHVAAEIFRALGVSEVRLMTNNPAKVEGLQKAGIIVTKRQDHSVSAHELNRDYLDTKRERMGHLLDTGTNVELGKDE